MSDNGLPKATMVNYIKDRISDKRKVSAQFTALLLELSRQFIDKVSAQANEICQKEGKKTINNDHFFGALKKLGMGDIINELEKTDESLKIKQQKKNQDKMRVQKNIQQLNKRNNEMDDEKVKEKVPMLEKIRHHTIQLDHEHDFVEILQQDDSQDGEDGDNQ